MPFPFPPPQFFHRFNCWILEINTSPPPTPKHTHSYYSFFFTDQCPHYHTLTLYFQRKQYPQILTRCFFSKINHPPFPKQPHTLSFQISIPLHTHTHTIFRTVFFLQSIPPLLLNQAKNYSQIYCISCF